MAHNRTRTCLMFALLAAFAADANAAPAASGSAYDVSIHLSLAGLLSFDVTPPDAVTFANQTVAWSGSQQSPSLNTGVALAHVSADNLSAVGEWIPDGRFVIVGTQSTVNNLNLNVVDAGASNVLTLAATIVQATALVGGTCPATAKPAAMATSLSTPASDFLFFDEFETRTLTAQGGGDPNGLGVTALGSSLLGLPVTPPPNTTVTLPGGLGLLVLNEHAVTGDGITGLAESSNGLHATLSLAGIATGEIVIAHADASIACQ